MSSKVQPKSPRSEAVQRLYDAAKDTQHWMGETVDDAKRLASEAGRKVSGMERTAKADASRWDTMHNPAAMAQYQGPPDTRMSSVARDVMDPAHMPMRPPESLAEAAQMAGAIPTRGGLRPDKIVEILDQHSIPVRKTRDGRVIAEEVYTEPDQRAASGRSTNSNSVDVTGWDMKQLRDWLGY